MFGLSYLWHGLFLNDYKLINYPIGIYIASATITYLIIGFIVSRMFLLQLFDKISVHPMLRGPAIGFACGLLIYIVAIAIQTVNASGYGSIVTFNKEWDIKYLLLDITWQGIEQGVGGLLIGIVYMLVYEPLPQMAEEE
jgi:hypothetical protein